MCVNKSVCKNWIASFNLVPSSCADLHKRGERKDGVYTIDPDHLQPFRVYCDMTTDGGGWTLLQRRIDGSEDFYRGWLRYKNGFGNLAGEFWLGLEKIHRLTMSGQDSLRIDLGAFNGDTRYAKYGNFFVAGEPELYELSVANYSGNLYTCRVYKKVYT